jgi:hypothetical protein
MPTPLIVEKVHIGKKRMVIMMMMGLLVGGSASSRIGHRHCHHGTRKKERRRERVGLKSEKMVGVSGACEEMSAITPVILRQRGESLPRPSSQAPLASTVDPSRLSTQKRGIFEQSWGIVALSFYLRDTSFSPCRGRFRISPSLPTGRFAVQ